MRTQAVTFLLTPPVGGAPWRAVLLAAAVLLIAYELAALVRRVRRGCRSWKASAAAAALLAAAAATWTTWQWPDAPPVGAIVAIAGAAVLWMVRSYGRTTAPLAAGWKAALLGLRIAVVGLLAAWALGPTLAYRSERLVRGVILIGVDTSASMRRRDMPGDVRRIDAVKQTLDAQRPALRRLAESADVEFFSFATSALPAGRITDEPSTRRPDAKVTALLGPATGPATAIGDAAFAAFNMQETSRREVAAIILVSDGCNNTADAYAPVKLAEHMASRGVPIHTVGVGSETVTASTRTLHVKALSAPDEVEAFNRLPITATVEAVGLAGRKIEVTCRFGPGVVETKELAVADPRRTETVRFVHVPLRSGFHRLSVSAALVGPPPPWLAGRREATKLVHVVDRGLRVLYVEGKFRYESKYIARALAAARRFSVDRRILLQPLRAGEAPTLGEKLDDWLVYHAIVFGDVAASHFTTRQLEIVRDLVREYGKGFCMLGGSKSFGRGGWAGTPVADVLPIDAARSAGQITGQVKVVPTPDGLASEMMFIQAEGADAASAWAELAPLPGANKLVGAKPIARVLAATPAGEPLIVAQRYGKGRCLAIAFDTTWRWVLSAKDTAQRQRRFWRQVVLYLAAPKGNVWIVTNKTAYDLRRLATGAEVIEVAAGVEDPAGRPLPGIPVTVALTGPDKKATAVELRVDENLRRGRLLPPTRPGLYTLTMAATVDGKPLTAEHRFDVVRRDLESLDVLANLDLLRAMAKESNGHYVALADLDALLAEVRTTTRPRRAVVFQYRELSSELRWYFVVALIALLCIEWAVRKRRGLV